MRQRGRRIAYASVVVGLVVLIRVGFTGKSWIVEMYHIQRLGSSDGETRLEAAGPLPMLSPLVPFRT